MSQTRYKYRECSSMHVMRDTHPAEIKSCITKFPKKKHKFHKSNKTLNKIIIQFGNYRNI